MVRELAFVSMYAFIALHTCAVPEQNKLPTFSSSGAKITLESYQIFHITIDAACGPPEVRGPGEDLDEAPFALLRLLVVQSIRKLRKNRYRSKSVSQSADENHTVGRTCSGRRGM